MGHVDGLSRLPIDRVDALTLANLLNAAKNSEDVVEDTCGEKEKTDHGREYGVPEDGRDGHDEEGEGVDVPASAGDVFGLDVEQQEVAWIWALGAFLDNGALPADLLLRAQVVEIAPRHSVESGLLMRLVHLPARVGSARSLTVPVVPLPYIPTVLHYCHLDLSSSHLGLTKALEKVRRQVYWPG
ncbi:hypothetical protein PI124_g13931 [Phytophthora idaei]|nr:hypothetical protein PI125_g22224 [Phytophthora idaei]KAG3151224.1 hypothetical protein PI126_g11108 [Phytophthora idaei]KAG3241193.1 hypothetical protein PI124_g13931 [Phytophthora idaei]